ncbi:hypothetical protein CsatB_026699 [Cannabis sativa]
MRIILRGFLIWTPNTSTWRAGVLVVFLLVLSDLVCSVSGLGSMSSIAVSYGEKGAVFCGLETDGSHLVACYGSNSAITNGTPVRFPFLGLTAGDGFVCGLLMNTNQPYCWGSSGYIQMGVPQPMIEGVEYIEIGAGDYHLCGLRKPITGKRRNTSFVDCWGYNMTKNYEFDGQIHSISAGSEFSCGLFAQNRTVFCWGDETSSRVSSLIPKEMRFQKIAAGGYHVCGILEGVNSRAFCWGRSLDIEEEISVAHSPGQGNVDLAPNDPMLSVVGGKFHACGIRSYDRGVICWGFIVKPSTSVPNGIKVYEIIAGNYFTCGILADRSLLPVCWGSGFPTSLPLAVSPGLCKSTPCAPDFYELSHKNASCKDPNSRICLPCSSGCPAEMYEKTECGLNFDRHCEYNCSICNSAECVSNCSSYSNALAEKKNERFWSLQLPVIIAEIAFAVFLVIVVSLTAVLYVRYKLRDCQCSTKDTKSKKSNRNSTSFQKDNAILDPVLKLPSDVEALKRIANVACKCVRMRGKERPSMDKVTTSLERALALLMGSPCNEQPILPTEVVLGSSRLHKKPSQRSSNRSASETDVVEGEEQRIEFRAPSWITFPSVASSQRRKSSVSEADLEGKNLEAKNSANDGLRSLEEEIGPASPQENLFLQHNF